MTDAEVRCALRPHLLASLAGARGVVDELWVPVSNERVDVAVIGGWMDGFEIKTERDTLKRLPRQVVAYGRLFDRCTAVVAERHSPRVEEVLPEWWGLTTVEINGGVTFTTVRAARPNPAVDPEILVRLLWREEAMRALLALGHEPQQNASRGSLWADLLGSASLCELKSVVRCALLNRDPLGAKMPNRRFASAASAASGP